MDFNLIWIFFCIYFDKVILLTTGVAIETAIFQIRRRHLDIRQCAMDALRDHTCVGGRISDLTGACEKLTKSLQQIQTMEPGYGYFEKVYYKKDFQRADKSSNYTDVNIPGPLTSGNKLAFTFTRTPPIDYMITFDDYPYRSESESQISGFSIRILESASKLNIFEEHSSRACPFNWRTFCPLVECKFSVAIKDGHQEILANDRIIDDSTCTLNVSLTSLRQMRIVVSNIV